MIERSGFSLDLYVVLRLSSMFSYLFGCLDIIMSCGNKVSKVVSARLNEVTSF